MNLDKLVISTETDIEKEELNNPNCYFLQYYNNIS